MNSINYEDKFKSKFNVRAYIEQIKSKFNFRAYIEQLHIEVFRTSETEK